MNHFGIRGFNCKRQRTRLRFIPTMNRNILKMRYFRVVPLSFELLAAWVDIFSYFFLSLGEKLCYFWRNFQF